MLESVYEQCLVHELRARGLTVETQIPIPILYRDLRLEGGFRLVADDRTILWESGGKLYGRAPDALSGLIEARGIGVVSVAPLALARVRLIVACAAAPDAVERLPEPQSAERAGVLLPVLKLWPFEPAAAAKLRRAIGHLGQRR